jgi:tetratricopeptide (TPR) repeat protein
MKLYKLAPLCGVLLLAVISSGCSKLKARDQLNKGVQAYRNAQFQPAIVYFKNAVQLDPSLLNARLYLATAYAQQYIPGGDSPENAKIAEQAIDSFEDVMKMDPGNTTAIASIAQIYYNQKKFDKAKEYQQRRLAIEPNNPEPYYWIGVLDWATCFPRAQTVRKDHNIDMPKNPAHPDVLDPIPDKYREDLAAQNGPLVDEGVKALTKAIELKPNDFDTMAYLNLMYRQKSEIDPDAGSRQADLKSAESWVEKALATKKAAAASSTTTGVVTNQ